MKLYLIELIGFIASAISVFSFMPQVYKVYREKKVEGLSGLTFFSLMAGGLAWISYGYLVNSKAVVITNSLISFMTLLILIAKIIFRKETLK
ncbi:SemiSWEET family sugar transporter [Candidatus Odyssella thessalonicensis]|uniref:SemiSWEET family sugar transporter n=1 Tax=Candidatus Odyssella thessalonicensis TaxID=84647 RepID=UPI000225A99D|nr:SemiSWEET family transporter [Candidatus Odyssella thessalonicensis]